MGCLHNFFKINNVVLHVVLIIFSLVILYSSLCFIKNEISFFKPENIDQSETAAQILNHANTMYWFSRANGNSMIELEQAKKLSKQALLKLEKSTDSQDIMLKHKAEKIIANADSSLRQNLLTVNNRYPYFLDFVGLNTIPEEDQMNEDLDIFSTKKILKSLVEVPDVLSSRPLKDVPYFTLLVHNTKDAELVEAATQIMNLYTNHYTISNHEIAEIAGSKNFDMEKLITDTVFLEKVRQYFNCGQVAIIQVLKHDQYNGLFYYGSRFKLYAPETGRNDLNRYIETFVQARGYNNTISNIIPLFIIFLLVLFLGVELARGINFFIFDWGKYWLNLLISGVLSAISSIVALETLFYFFKPESGEFIETDKALFWIFLVACCFTIVPIILGHLVLGKLDRLFLKFDSALDKREGLFFIIWPALSTYGLALNYYSLLRFGFTNELIVVAYAYVSALVFSLLITYYWMRIKELPEEAVLLKKFLVYIPLIYSIGAAVVYPWFTFGIVNHIEIMQLFLYTTMPPLFFSGLIFFIEQSGIYKSITKNKIPYKVIDNEVNFEIEENMIDSINTERVLVVYGAKRMGKTCLTQRLTKKLLPNGIAENIITIDFSLNPEDEKDKINYYPFAKGFAHLLPHSAFNDHAEEAKKSGNIIGKLIGAISAAGSFLVDDSESVPAEINKIKELLFTKITTTKISLVIFENIHEANGESKELFLALLKKFCDYGKSMDKEKNIPLPYLIFTSSSGFHIKRKFEVLIENYANSLQLNETSLSNIERKLFYDLKFEKAFLKKFLEKLNLNILDQQKLLQRIAGDNKYNSPGHIQKVIDLMKDNNMLIEQSNGVHKLKPSYNEIILPEIDEEIEPFEEALKKLDKEILNILQSCAYSSLPNGDFEIDAVCCFTQKSRIEILQLLKNTEELNFVYDVRNKDDWYSFNDIRYMLALKRIDGNNIKEVSQLGKEYYAKWVDFYWKKKELLFANVHLNKEILISLIDKSYAIRDSHCELSFEILKQLGFLFCEPKLSMLEKSELAFDRALDILSEFSFKFESVNKIDIEIEGMLRTLDAKNELNLPKAKAILNNAKQQVNLSKDQKLYIQYLDSLAFSKSDNYNANVALTYISKNTETINNLPTDDIKNKLHLNFVNILLEPKRSATLDQLKEILKRLQDTITFILDNLNSDDSVKEIHKQLLNHSAGVIIDNILGGKFELSKEDKLVYVKQALSLLFQRLKLEIQSGLHVDDSTHIEYHSLLKAIYDFHEKEILKAEKEYSIDRKGLSYTYNYLVRLIYTLHDYTIEKELIIVKESVNLAEYAEKLNKEVNDQMGIIMALSFNGLFKILEGETKVAFKMFEEAFAYSFYNMKDFQMNKALENFKKLDKNHLDKNEIEQLDKYKKIVIYRHILRHFEAKSFNNNKINDMIRDNYIVSEDDLKKLTSVPGSKFDGHTFSCPDKVLIKINELQKTCKLKIDYDTAYLEEDIALNVGRVNIMPKDAIPEGFTIKVEKREGHAVNVVEGIESPKTTFLFAAFNMETKEINTACPGKYAPKLPGQITEKDEVLKQNQMQASKDYWNEHVFIKN